MNPAASLRSSARAAVRRAAPGCPLGAAPLWSQRAYAVLAPRPFRRALETGDAAPFWVAFDRVLAPMADAAADASGLARRVAWGNLAGRLAAMLEGWEADPATRPAAVALRAATLDAPDRPDGRPNPLHRALLYVPCPAAHGGGARVRRVCCIRDRAGMPLCASCPRITEEARVALLAQPAFQTPQARGRLAAQGR